ncbi:MAG: DUF3298 and DUF4163 domain-containing protein [Lachnospiraceae bacterium]
MRAKSIFMKKLGAIALAAGVVFGALSVNAQPVSAATGFQVVDKKYEKTYKQDNGNVYFEAKGVFPEIKSNTKAAKKINQELKKAKTEWIGQSKKMASDANTPLQPSMNASDRISYEVTSNDGKYFSVLMSGYDYQGGAHGMPYRIPMTFNAKTGERLTAAKLFGTTKAKLNTKVRNLYLERYDKEGVNAGFYGDDAKPGKSAREILEGYLAKMNFNNAFYVKDSQVVFYANPYDVGPYAAGFIEVSAPVK